MLVLSLFALHIAVHRVDHILVVRELIGSDIAGGNVDKLRDAAFQSAGKNSNIK